MLHKEKPVKLVLRLLEVFGNTRVVIGFRAGFIGKPSPFSWLRAVALTVCSGGNVLLHFESMLRTQSMKHIGSFQWHIPRLIMCSHAGKSLYIHGYEAD
jgi:hypothetical protein